MSSGALATVILRSTGPKAPWRGILRRYLMLSVAAAAAFLVGLGNVVWGVEVRVDCSSRLAPGAPGGGTIRALHGVNNGPVNYGQTIDLSAYYRELKIPLARLHDSEWPNPDVVDIHAIFPDLNSDPALAGNYRFSRTDDYIKAIVDTGARIVYRLGESIEMTQKKYNVAPPSDYEKWTGACIGIIRHYNEGWADGFRYAIPYWEIWNEPENRPNMWTGSDEDYYRLYATAAKAIKARFPEIKVGGPSIGAPGELARQSTGGLVEAQGAERERLKPTAFLQGFLDFCKKSSVPLDFFSWHTYSDNPYVFAQKARAVRRLLDEYGFSMTENHLNEWNYLPDNDWTPMSLSGQGLVRQRWYEKMGGAHGAAFVVCTLIYLQDSPVDVANFYSGDTNQFGLFNRYGAPKKTFYAMKAFVALLDTPVRVKASGSKPAGAWAGKPGDMAVCAGINQAGTEAAILVGNFRCEEKDLQLSIEHLPWRGDVQWEIFRIDSSHDLECVRSGSVAVEAQGLAGEIRLTESLEAPCVLLVRLHKTATPPGPKAGQAVGE